MNTTALRQKILDLAIHGKLVKQDPTDENAAVLLEKIRAEKEKKIASGELKRDKNDSYIFIGDDNRHYEKFADGRVKDIEDELPFAVPEGWAWCRLGDVCSIIMGQSPESSFISNNSDGMEFHQGKIHFTEKYIQKANNYTFSITKIAPKNAILLCVRAPVGVVNITEREICIGRGLCSIYPKYQIQSEFWFYWLQWQKDTFEQKATGTTFQAISIELIKNILIPLPPLSEQHRIVIAIEAMFTQIALLEQNKVDLQTVVKQAKSKILDLAIHGKLVPQDPADEPASVMLERLRAEKEAKIAAGEIKCGKNDSYIYKNSTDNCYYEKIDGKNDIRIDDELLFELPKSWQWTKLGRICDKLIDGDHNPPKGIEEKTEYIMVSSRNINYNTVADLENVRYLTKEMFEAENLRTNATAGDILFTSVGSLGRSCIYDGSLNICFQRSVSILKTAIYNKYLKFFFDSKFYQNYVVEHATGTAQTGFYLQEMAESFIAIPPILEQKRIVAKIEELFNALDKIQNNLI